MPPRQCGQFSFGHDAYPSTSGYENRSNHSAECPILSNLDPEDVPEFSGDKPASEYSCILPLRMLRLKKTDPEMWSRVEMLMDHNDTMTEDERNMWKARTSTL